jgi:hypothetical protein
MNSGCQIIDAKADEGSGSFAHSISGMMAALADAEGRFRSDLSPDGTDPNAKGYAIMERPLVESATGKGATMIKDPCEPIAGWNRTKGNIVLQRNETGTAFPAVRT